MCSFQCRDSEGEGPRLSISLSLSFKTHALKQLLTIVIDIRLVVFQVVGLLAHVSTSEALTCPLGIAHEVPCVRMISIMTTSMLLNFAK